MRGFFTSVKYTMEYKLYTLVDITHTGQHRNEQGKEGDRWREQNFQTIVQTLGLRSNISFTRNPEVFEVGGRLIGFDTDEIIRVWRFDWSTEQDLYSIELDPVAYLRQDFHLIPYIQGLSELMEQEFAVFNTGDPGKNIVFYLKQ